VTACAPPAHDQVAAPAPRGDVPFHRLHKRARRPGRRALALLAFTAALTAAGVPGTGVRPAHAADGRFVHAFGRARDLGPDGSLSPNGSFVDAAALPDASGYWLAAADGGVFAFGSARFFGSMGGTPLGAPIVGIAAAPDGRGYWLVAADGGVFAFGSARFFGSTGDIGLRAPIVGMAATPAGDGYWLAAADGGVFAFGGAAFAGAAVGAAAPVVAVAPAERGDGYYLLGRDGGVFAFGSARFRGSLGGAGVDDFVDIAAVRGGYYTLRRNGVVVAFGVTHRGAAADDRVPTVAIAATTDGYLTVRGSLVPEHPTVDPNLPFLRCTRAHESDTSGGYRAVNHSGKYRGAYQFDRPTWNAAARHAGREDLVGADPAAVAPADQDWVAWSYYQWKGAAPWGGRCR
jgi:hypothetical protein